MIGYVTLVAALVSAVALALCRPAHHPVAVVLALGLASDLGQLLARVFYANAPRPFTGAPRVAFHVGQALHLSWPALVVGLCLATLANRSWRPALAAWASLCAALIVAYPAARGATLHDVYGAWQLACFAACVWCLTLRRPGVPDVTQAVAVALGASLGGVWVGGYLGPPFRLWDLPQMSCTMAFVFVVLAQVRTLCLIRPRSQ